MANPLDEAFERAPEVATHDGQQYRRVTLICKRSGIGEITPFCTVEAWLQTSIMQLAALNAEIAALRAENARLKAQATLEHKHNGECPLCKKALDPRGLAGHMWGVHRVRKSEYDARARA